MELITAPHLDKPDDFYEALIEAHRGLDSAASHALNARLVLVLANHIGSQDVLEQALLVARAGAANSCPKLINADNIEHDAAALSTVTAPCQSPPPRQSPDSPPTPGPD